MRTGLGRVCPWAFRLAIGALMVSTLGACAVMRTLFGYEEAAPAPKKPPPPSPLATPAERSGYTRTATTAEVSNYLGMLARRSGAYDSAGRRDTLMKSQAPMDLFAIDTTAEGRDIPVVIAARPMVRTGAEAHANGRAVVYVQAGIQGGEVDGKDAMLALVRDLVLPAAASPNKSSILDSLVLVIVPVANPDGNDALGPGSVNRPDQRGPDSVGTDGNASGLNLNRDFVKAETRETQVTLALLRTWDPDVFVDLHTSDGSFHRYTLTYAPPEHPASVFTGPYTRDSLLPVLQQRMRDRHQIDAFDYGHFVPDRPPLPTPDIDPHRWVTLDYRPRFGTNYMGLRDRIAILGAAYAHDSLSRRIAVQRVFVREVLSLVAERTRQIRSLVRVADSTVSDWGADPDQAPDLPLAGTLIARGPPEPVEAEDVEQLPDRTPPGAPDPPPEIRPTGRYRTLTIPVMDRYDGTRPGRLPGAYLVPAADTGVARLLARHGILVQRLSNAEPARIVEHFMLDSVAHDSAAVEGHHLSHPYGHWLRVIQDTTLGAGTYVVPCAQPLAILAYELLEPESADGFVTWNLFDAEMQAGGSYPVARLRR